MHGYRPTIAVSVSLLLALLACTPSQPRAGPCVPSVIAEQPTPKRLTVAVMADIPVFYNRIQVGGIGRPGQDAVEDLVNASLGVFDNGGDLRPQLAEAIPSVENG